MDNEQQQGLGPWSLQAVMAVTNVTNRLSEVANEEGEAMVAAGKDPRAVNSVLITAALSLLAEQIAYGTTPGQEGNMMDDVWQHLGGLVDIYANERDKVMAERQQGAEPASEAA